MKGRMLSLEEIKQRNGQYVYLELMKEGQPSNKYNEDVKALICIYSNKIEFKTLHGIYGTDDETEINTHSFLDIYEWID